MVTTLRAGLNTFPTSVTGGSTPDANRIITVEDWAMALEPRITPLLTDIGIGPSIDQRPHYWGQSKRVAVKTNLSGAHNNSTTTLTVTSGTGVILQKYMVLEIINFIAGSTTIFDQTRREIVHISAEPVADTATIIRAMSGTTAINHDDQAQVNVIGVAEPELQSHTIAPVTRGAQVYNYVQRFQGGVKADIAARNTPTWEHRTDPMLRDFEEEQKKQKFLLEMSIWRGGRQAGDPTTPIGATMGGLDTFILTNVTNAGGARLTPRSLEATLRDLAKNVEMGPEGIRLLMSYNTAAIFDAMLDPIREATAGDTTLTSYTDTVRFRFGAFKIGVSHNCPDGVIYGIRPEYMSVRPYKGLTWHVSTIKGQDFGQDNDSMFISGDFTFVLEREASMFKLWNFNQDLNAYDSVFAR